jgi:hypothetical protein
MQYFRLAAPSVHCFSRFNASRALAQVELHGVDEISHNLKILLGCFIDWSTEFLCFNCQSGALPGVILSSSYSSQFKTSHGGAQKQLDTFLGS